MVVNVSNLTGILIAVFFHCTFNVKSDEMTSAKHGTKILNRFFVTRNIGHRCHDS